MGACDTCGCGYVHPFQLMGVAETAQIAVYAKDKELFDIAKLYWLGCNQTVETEEHPWDMLCLDYRKKDICLAGGQWMIQCLQQIPDLDID